MVGVLSGVFVIVGVFVGVGVIVGGTGVCVGVMVGVTVLAVIANVSMYSVAEPDAFFARIPITQFD
jgi:hypothetical protein